MIEYFIPVKTKSEANMREHWAVKRKRTSKQRKMGMLLTRNALNLYGFGQRKGLQITLTRIGARKLDSDNLAGSMKAVRDGIADALGINDGDESAAVWCYSQKTMKEAKMEPCVVVKIELLSNP